MKDFKVSVRKVTDESLMREACESTFLGTSHTSLANIYKSEHSPARTQLFWITLENIKTFIATHYVRHHVGVVPFQLTCREDRKGGNVQFIPKVTEVQDKIRLAQGSAVNHDLNVVCDILNDAVSSLDWLKEYADRNTRVNLSLMINAQSLIDMAKVRDCFQAHKETREVFAAIREAIAKVDPDLAAMMVKKCIYRNGLCGEPKCCGYNSTSGFKEELEAYTSRFDKTQKGLL